MSPNYVIGYRDGFNGRPCRSCDPDYVRGYWVGERRKVAAPASGPPEVDPLPGLPGKT